MLTYLNEPKESLLLLKAGMEKNPTLWTDKTVQTTEVDQLLTDIQTADASVEETKQQLSIKLSGARDVSTGAFKLAEKIENLASGLHNGDAEKLMEYGIKPKKTKETIPAPTKILIPKLEDDTDGEGFIISTQKDTAADYYEWQKGTSASAADANTIPELKNFKTTKKINFVDDDVTKGVRTFYRVRAANRNGVGPWSEAVSRVQ
jgi:hypothetical protein